MSSATTDDLSTHIPAQIPGRRGAINPIPGKGWIVAMLISFAFPVIVPLGSVNLLAYKVVLLFAFFPLVARWMSGQAGPVRGPDIMIILFCLWAAFGLAVRHPVSKTIEASGQIILETFVAYLIGRALIRNREAFEFFIKALCVLILVLGIFGAIEAFTGTNLITAILDPVFKVGHAKPMPDRWGMTRAAVSFDHQILYGVFCAMAFTPAWMVLAYRGDGIKRSHFWVVTTVAATFFSLSAGAYLFLIVNSMLMAWDRILSSIKQRWWILILGFATVYIALELLSNRGPIKLMASYASFNAQAAYIRIDQWTYGTAAVMNHPFFGMGFHSHNWERPVWLPPSVDHMWLAMALRHGLGGLFFLLGAYVWIVIALARREIHDHRLAAYRRAGVITFVGLYLASSTVFLWEGPYVLLNIFMGSLVWMLDAPAGTPAQSGTAPESPTGKSRRTANNPGTRTPETLRTRSENPAQEQDGGDNDGTSDSPEDTSLRPRSRYTRGPRHVNGSKKS